MRRLLVLICVVVWAVSCCAKDVKIHGFVTNIQSSNQFDIDDYKITRDVTLSLEVEKDESGASVAEFKPEEIRVGTELEIKGDYNESTGELRAKSIKVFLDDTRKIKRTALLERVPELKGAGGGWTGTLFADGQRVSVNDKTVATFVPNKGERKQAKSNHEAIEPRPLLSTDKLDLDTFVHYEGFRQGDGTVLASKLEFRHAELEQGEAKMWKQLTPKFKQPDFNSFKSGELRVYRSRFKVVPSKEAQEYVSRLGNSLIPQRQKELAANDPLKIPFHFYLIQDDSFNAAAYPNGVVIVHSGVFKALENEAQLAFVLSHEITHAVEKHTWQQHEYHKKALMALRIGGIVGAGFGGSAVADMANMVEAGIRNGYARSLENQADRVGMERMLASGYDIREAPRAWKAVSKRYGDHAKNIFWDAHDNNTTRRSYLMAELKNNYSDTDYAVLKRDSDDFHRIAEVVTKAEFSKKKVKIKVK